VHEGETAPGLCPRCCDEIVLSASPGPHRLQVQGKRAGAKGIKPELEDSKSHGPADSLSNGCHSPPLQAHDLRSETVDLKSKLEDSKSQLQSNEQMIRWLNQQVGDVLVFFLFCGLWTVSLASRAVPSASRQLDL